MVKRGEESLQDFLEIFGGNKMRKGVIAAIAVASLGLAVAVSHSKPGLPEQFKSLDGTIAGEYLLAGLAERNSGAYQRAATSIGDPYLKAQFSAFASNDLYRQAQHTQSTYQRFRDLEMAVMIAPSQEARERMIDSSLAIVEPYKKNLDIFHSGIAALYLRSVAGKTSDPRKRNQLLNQAADIYAGLAELADSHTQRANYLSAAKTLRQGTS